MLVAECYECHAGKKAKGGLRVDHRDALLQGGHSGPAIVPGDAAKSLLIATIRHEQPDQEMPKNGAKLDVRIIADFVAWVNAGAFDPRNAPPATNAVTSTWADTLALRRQWWSLQPLKPSPLPSPTNAAWSQHPIDRFLVQGMEAYGLHPAAPADPRTFIRRVTFAMTGLPPRPADIDAFLKECGEGDDAARIPESALLKLVDRLLASPTFGERWARHWMDLMRYAETHGSEGDPEIRSAWRYRDYLIRAFNADVPADQLIREHLAGDLLPPSQIRWNQAEGLNESVIGTASLRLNEHGFQPIDTLDEQVRVIENQIDVIGKAFQGLTIACARCHDHKFDAVSQRDYYALYGVLASSRPAQILIDAPVILQQHREQLAALKEPIKTGLIEAWQEAVPRLIEQMERSSSVQAQRTRLAKRVRDLESRIGAIEAEARAQVLSRRNAEVAEPGARGSNGAVRLPLPLARWSFDADARDHLGNLHGELLGGATIRSGRLVLNGKDAQVRTAAMGRELREKTLEAWVALTTLEQGGGGVLTVESADGAVFDSIVFAEKEPLKWVNGSDFFRRSRLLNGLREGAKGDLVHVAITYQADGSIAFFRNGVAYGASFQPGAPLVTFARDARVLLGRRHTGGGDAFLTGEIDEARLYDRALSPEEIAASFRGGPDFVSAEELTQAMTGEHRTSHAALSNQLVQTQKQIEALAAAAPAALAKALKAAEEDTSHPLHAWSRLESLEGEAFANGWSAVSNRWHAQYKAAREHNARFTTKWDLADDGGAGWFRYGPALPSATPTGVGEFSVESEGRRIITGLLPAGVFNHLLSQKHGGLLTSPRFKIETDSISVRAAGGQGAMVRLIVDNYPLGINPTYPRVELERGETGWMRLDTAYRKGSWAYLEVATSDLLTRRGKGAESQPRSWFGIERVVVHDSASAPREEPVAGTLLFRETAPASREELAARYSSILREAFAAWRKHELSEPQRAFLHPLIRDELLPSALETVPKLQSLIAEYRSLEAAIAPARHAPGVLDGTADDAPLMERGDHHTLAAAVPRGFVEVLGKAAFFGAGDSSHASGRLELANAITDPANPLTARVMVNRVWGHLFGRGLVPTVDNFGRLGEQPTHPELLDYLATRFLAEGWSFKRLIREIVSSRAYQMSSEPSAAAREVDAANRWHSYFPARRLEAEAIRDAMLAVAGRLDAKLFGPPVTENASPRRSIYLAVRRTKLNPFLESFDAPKPFTTRGQRDVTNVPAQSLALLNDPFVIEVSRQWASSLLSQAPNATADARIRTMFVSAFAREPSEQEMKTAREFLGDLARVSGVAAERIHASERVWADFAHALFNLKEFIYVR